MWKHCDRTKAQHHFSESLIAHFHRILENLKSPKNVIVQQNSPKYNWDGNNIELRLYLDTSTHFFWMTFGARLMKRRWTGIGSYFPLHSVRKWCFRHLWVQSGIPICLLEIGNGGTARRDVVKVCSPAGRTVTAERTLALRGPVAWSWVWTRLWSVWMMRFSCQTHTDTRWNLSVWGVYRCVCTDTEDWCDDVEKTDTQTNTEMIER